jgi:DNA-binding NtrC family response regulator
VDTPVRLLVVDPDAANLTSVTILAEEEGIEVRTAVDANGAIRQCRLGYLDLVMIDSGADGTSGVTLLQTIRTVRPTVRAVLMRGARTPWQLQCPLENGLESLEKPLGRGPFRQLLRKLRSEPRHVPDGLSELAVERKLCAAPSATRMTGAHS